MIQWQKPIGYARDSSSPKGYTIAMSPFGDLCHFEAWFNGPDGPVLIGQHRDLHRDDRGARAAAEKSLRAACEDHVSSSARPGKTS